MAFTRDYVAVEIIYNQYFTILLSLKEMYCYFRNKNSKNEQKIEQLFFF